jgi:hypothetical protein
MGSVRKKQECWDLGQQISDAVGVAEGALAGSPCCPFKSRDHPTDSEAYQQRT